VREDQALSVVGGAESGVVAVVEDVADVPDDDVVAAAVVEVVGGRLVPGSDVLGAGAA
jgi:hypothetical protein